MAVIGIVTRPGLRKAKRLAAELAEWAEAHGHGVLFEADTARRLKWRDGGVSVAELLPRADPIVSLGGDGTLIGIARYVGASNPVLVGVNFGSLGFLTEVKPEELFQTLPTVLDGSAVLGHRHIIAAHVERNGETIFASQAVNDAVIQKGTTDPLVELDIFADHEAVMRLRADGVIISTPTGSTAYALAAGGSIVYPSLEVFLVTPICPHSLTNRPFIVPMEWELGVAIPPHSGALSLILDGQLSFELLTGDTIVIACSPHQVQFVRSPSKSYFQILRRKLNWGIANKS